MRTNNHKQMKFSVSVIMAVYNVEKYLKEAIDSLIAQDLGFEKIQIILVDDGSTDHSGRICDEYREKYPNNIIVIHKENGGVASARNEGLAHATGRFLNFMDSDDKMSKNAFSSVYSFFCEHENETDVVTIPIHFFGAKQGQHWQNWKFKQGNRIINLQEEYQTTAMFTSSTFFSQRIRNLIVFDSHLVVAEDMKVILTVLSQKMTLGVVTNCTFFYRRRETANTSLVTSATKKKGWYSDYLTYLVEWTFQFYSDRFGKVPKFVQYEIMCDLQWRFKNQDDMGKVLSEEEIEAYKSQLFAALRGIDDSIVTDQKILQEHHKCYILEKMHDQIVSTKEGKHDIRLFIGKTELQSVSSYPTIVDIINIEQDHLVIEGTILLHGIRPEQAKVSVFLQTGNEVFRCESSRKPNEDLLCFGELIQWALRFKGDIPLPVEIADTKVIEVVMKVNNTEISKPITQYGIFSPLSGRKSSYYSYNGYIIYPYQNKLIIKIKRSGESFKKEVSFLKALWSENKTGARKAVIVRTVYHILRIFKHKPIWLLSEQITKNTASNMEKLQKILQSKGKGIYYVIVAEKNDCHPTMKPIGKTVCQFSMKHKLLYLLCDYNVCIEGKNTAINPFRRNCEEYRDIVANKRLLICAEE